MRPLSAALVLLAGIAYTLFLQTAVPDEVFINGDAGMKALMTRQFAAGGWHADLRLPSTPEVESLWREGFYPFGPPFTYRLDGRVYIQYPLLFPAISAPFYRLLGYRGLTVLPLLGLWAAWAVMLVILRRTAAGVMAVTVPLAGAVFASHLSFYSATFWEHTLAVALSFAGLAPLLLEGDEGCGTPATAAAGVLLGLSVWLRPECALLAAGALLVTTKLDRPVSLRVVYAAAVVVTLAGFVLSNIWLYGMPLGVHAIQAVEPGQIDAPHLPPLSIAWDLGRYFLLFSPVLVAAAGVALAGWRLGGPLRPDRRELRMWILLAVFFAGTPFLLPTTGGKQFGPRFWLPAVPLLWMIVSFQLRRIAAARPRVWPRVLGGLLVLAVLAGGAFNIRLGTRYLFHDYRERVLPALDFLRSRDEVSVAVSHQYIAQELEALFGEKAFFRVIDDEGLVALAARLHERGQGGFLWLRFDPSGGGTTRLPSLNVSREVLGRYGEYFIFRCTVGRPE